MRAGLARHAFTALASFGFLFLLAPILMMVALSFNRTEGRFDFVWHGFSLAGWAHPFAVHGLLPALGTSVALALVVAAVATAIGTALALAQVRYQFAGTRAADVLLLLTIATPEVILGSALLDLFLGLGLPQGLLSTGLAHVTFDIAFVTIMVKSRLRGFDPSLEQAAADLGAAPLRVLRHVTLPLILPSILAAGLLALVLSLDDFIVTMFVSGQVVTFPLFVWGSARTAMPPQIYVVGTCIFAVLTAGLLALHAADRGRARGLAA
jgi:spermidine/putrescine transport system permease protein